MIPTSITELQEMVGQGGHLVAYGGGSKPALSTAGDGVSKVHLSGLSGILEYDPGEYTFTARAGTRLTDLESALAEHGQYLPFDPPLVSAGATLGGTVAAGLSGPGRYRYGGVRDFILGVRFVNGQGRLVRGGGKVVKNAAGFDLPKLMVGSLGQYGALVELSFKVFPRPAAFLTLRAGYPTLDEALQALIRLSMASLDAYALDLVPQGGRFSLLLRLGGLPGSFPARVARLQKGGAQPPMLMGPEVLEDEADAVLWQEAREFTWVPPGHALVKVPLTPRRVPALDARITSQGGKRRYSVAANLAWVAWPGPLENLEYLLNDLELSGLVLAGAGEGPRLGVRSGEAFARRVKQALDPQGRWREV